MSSETAFTPTAFPPLGSARERTSDAGARSRGHMLGYAAGRRQAEQEWAERRAVLEAQAAELAVQRAEEHATALRAVAAAARSVRSAVLPLLGEAGDALTGSAIELAEAIIGRELADPLTAVTAAVDRVMANESAALVVDLRLHPADAALLEDHADRAGGLSIVADSTIERGDAVAVLPDRILDAGIASALDRARRVLLEDEA